jgi:hypothetical protein
MDKLIKLTALLLLFCLKGFSQQNISSDSLGKLLSKHFEIHKAELYKYSSLKAYSEVVVPLTNEQIKKEQEFFNLTKSISINTTIPYIFELCHNLLVNSPDMGKECLQSLNKPIDNDDAIENLFMQVLFAEEFGEQLALNNLSSDNLMWKKRWSDYLSIYAIYETSIPQIEKALKQTSDLEITQNLLDALVNIGSPKAIPIVKQLIETTVDDEVQVKAFNAFKSLAGYDGIKYLQSAKPVGPLSGDEKKVCIQSLNTETSPQNKYGTNVLNDFIFIEKYGHVKSPLIIWIENQGLMPSIKENKTIKLTQEQKNQLFEALMQSKGFGLEAVKGTLFQNIVPSDIDKLIKLRKEGFYSPNKLSGGRVKIVSTMVGWLRKQA